MNKDNLLFAVVGILIGFVSAYLFFEAMASRQPPRLGAAAAPPAAAPMGQPAGPQGAPATGGGAGPAMAQVQELQNRLQQNPNDTDALRTLANLNFDIQNWQRAQELYSRYLEIRPNDPDVMVDLGVTHHELGQPDRALELFRQVQQQNPSHWQAYYNEVVVLAFALQRFDEADRVLARLRELQPGNPDVERLAGAVQQQRNAAS
ncbi:MAG TPA: tetratricopeptide repeat protein [Thermoanaerobaculia bacterium]|nr:tetratricopeptide repeat protein [Thermoanaerobaculia bacterium]